MDGKAANASWDQNTIRKPCLPLDLRSDSCEVRHLSADYGAAVKREEASSCAHSQDRRKSCVVVVTNWKEFEGTTVDVTLQSVTLLWPGIRQRGVVCRKSSCWVQRDW